MVGLTPSLSARQAQGRIRVPAGGASAPSSPRTLWGIIKGGSPCPNRSTHHHASTRRPTRRLVRTNDGRWLGGVAAGLGRYFDVNPLVYRIAFAALALVGGTGILLYLAAWLVIPAEDDDDSIAVEALRGPPRAPVGLLAFGALFALSEARFWPGTGNVWLAATLVGGALVWWHVSQRADRAARASDAAAPRRADAAVDDAAPLRRSDDESPGAAAAARPPKKPSLFAPVLGALLAAAGLFGLLAVLDIYDVDVAAALAGGRRDRRRRDRGRSDDAAARRRARLPRTAAARRVRASPR